MAYKDIGKTPHFSASQLGMYMRCPKQYEYRYMLGIKKPPNLNMIVGTGVHKSIEVNYTHKFKKKGKMLGESATMDAFGQAFEESKVDVAGDKVTKGKAKDQGYRMSETHYREVAPFVTPAELPEIEFLVPVPGVKRPMKGFIDLIALPAPLMTNKRVVIDNKTTRNKFQQLQIETSLQLTSYYHAHKVLYGKNPAAVGFDVVIDKVLVKGPKTETQRLVAKRNKAQVDEFFRTTQMIEKGVDAGVFPACNDHRICSWCGYNDVCPVAKGKVQWK